MTNATITLRKATPKDAADLLILDNMSSHGMSLSFWQAAVAKGEGEDPLSFARERFGDETSVFGWSNAIVAEANGMIIGGVTGYQMPEADADTDAIKKAFPGFVPVFELFEEAVGDWFIDSLAVYPDFRGRGVAGQLLDACLRSGKEWEYKNVSLVVEGDNTSAVRLYEGRGFRMKQTRPFVEGEVKSETNEWLLLSKPL